MLRFFEAHLLEIFFGKYFGDAFRLCLFLEKYEEKI